MKGRSARPGLPQCGPLCPDSSRTARFTAVAATEEGTGLAHRRVSRDILGSSLYSLLAQWVLDKVGKHVSPIPVRPASLLHSTLGDEVVVYNPETSEAHTLKGEIAAVWLAVEPGRGIADIAEAAGLGTEEVTGHVEKLIEVRLLDDARGPSRRTFVRGGAVVGGALIASALLPAAAAHASSGNITTPGAGTYDLPAGGATGIKITLTGAVGGASFDNNGAGAGARVIWQPANTAGPATVSFNLGAPGTAGTATAKGMGGAGAPAGGDGAAITVLAVTSNGSGGGGGASSATLAGKTVRAGGGGGGGTSAAASAGGAGGAGGSNVDGTGTGTAGKTGTAGTDGANKNGSTGLGGGGGLVANAAVAGTSASASTSAAVPTGGGGGGGGAGAGGSGATGAQNRGAGGGGGGACAWPNGETVTVTPGANAGTGSIRIEFTG